MANQNKVRVTSLFGTGADQGLMDPKVNMKVKHGIDTRWIVTASQSGYQFNDDDLIDLAQVSGGAIVGQAYPHNCLIFSGDANYFGWPGSTDSVTFGHHSIFPHGVPVVPGSGMVYEDGGGNEIHFSRTLNPS